MQTLLGKDSTISHRENYSRFPYLSWDELVDAFFEGSFLGFAAFQSEKIHYMSVNSHRY